MTIEERIAAFVALGKKLGALTPEEKQHWVAQARANNNWFTDDSVKAAINGIIVYLQEDKLKKWLADYTFSNSLLK